MNEKSAAGASLKAAMLAVIALLVAEATAAVVRGGPNDEARPALPPKRPPDRLSHPSTLSRKKGVRTRRFDVRPPCEWPTSQKALIFSLPICSTREVTMFCRYSSSVADHVLVGELGVAITSRYLSR